MISINISRIKGDYEYNTYKIKLLKSGKFFKKPRSPKKKLNEIEFIYYYKIIYMKKILSH